MAQNLSTIIGWIRAALKRAYSFLRHVSLPKLGKTRSWVGRYWLPLFLAGLCFGFGVLGVYWYRSGLPPKLEAESLPLPATVNVLSAIHPRALS